MYEVKKKEFVTKSSELETTVLLWFNILVNLLGICLASTLWIVPSIIHRLEISQNLRST